MGAVSSTKSRLTGSVLLVLLALCLSMAAFAGISGEPVTLRVGVFAGSYWDTPSGDAYHILDDAIRRFEAEHPNVMVTYDSGILPGDYSEWLAEQILLGQEPDVYFVLPEDFNLLAVSGALAKLDGFMEADPDFDADRYYVPCLRSGVFDGSQYALPYESVPTLMFVNKTLLTENGIEVPENDWTWEDFYDICDRVTRVEEGRFGVYGYAWTHALYANGASLFSEDGTACYLASPPVQEAIRFVKSLTELNGGYTVTSRDFDLGSVAFRPFLYSDYRAWQPYPYRVKRYTGFEWDCVSMPAGPEGGNVSELHTMLLGISSRSRRQGLAWEFARLLSAGTEVQSELYTWSHGVSPLRDVAEDPEILERLREDVPGHGGYSQSMVRNIMSTAVVAPRFSGCDQAMMLAERAVEDLLNEDETGENQILTVQREINILLRET